MTCAIGSAADDEVGRDTFNTSLFIDYQ